MTSTKLFFTSNKPLFIDTVKIFVSKNLICFIPSFLKCKTLFSKFALTKKYLIYLLVQFLCHPDRILFCTCYMIFFQPN